MVNVEDLKPITQQLQGMTNRIVLAILVAATILAAVILLVVWHPPFLDPLAGWLIVLVFAAAVAFGVWLIGSIRGSGRK